MALLCSTASSSRGGGVAVHDLNLLTSLTTPFCHLLEYTDDRPLRPPQRYLRFLDLRHHLLWSGDDSVSKEVPGPSLRGEFVDCTQVVTDLGVGPGATERAHAV